MKIRFTLLMLVISISSFSQNIAIISDYDDTYRITNTTKKMNMYWNALLTKRVFVGMDSLYSLFEKKFDTIFFVSNSPEMIRKKIKKNLKKHGLTKYQLFLYEEGEKFKHKYQSISGIIKRHPNKKFILLGDDSTEDHLVYAKIAKDFPDAIHRIYIRPVMNRKTEKGIYRFYSAYDIAFYETEDKIISEENALKIGSQILNSKKQKNVLPKFLSSPATPYVPCCDHSGNKLKELRDKINEYLISID